MVIPRPVALLVALACASCGCDAFRSAPVRAAHAAERTFVRQTFCPAERVVVTPLPDLKPAYGPTPPAPELTPPPDVASDPARLDIWYAQTWRERSSASGENEEAAYEWANTLVVDVRGCDADLVYVCRPDSHHTPYCLKARASELH